MIFAYPVKGKQKSLDICTAFAAGCGAQVVPYATRLMEGPAFFYGIDESNQRIWDEVRKNAAQEFYYCDNSYFDDSRQQYFRITKNRLQHSGQGTSNGKRFDALDIKIKPMREAGEHIVVCPQSDTFMKNIVGYRGNWTQDAMEDLKRLTKRPLRLRLWSGDKARLAATLGEDLLGAHALITWSSAAAISAILAGVPAICSNQCAAAPVAEPSIDNIEAPMFYSPLDVRRQWAGVLADNQWTLDEMRRGVAWEALYA